MRITVMIACWHIRICGTTPRAQGDERASFEGHGESQTAVTPQQATWRRYDAAGKPRRHHTQPRSLSGRSGAGSGEANALIASVG
jgi:hypothetical protein